MPADAEAEIGILVQHLARFALIGGDVAIDEVAVEQASGKDVADGLLALASGGGLERPADFGAQSFRRVGHFRSPYMSGDGIVDDDPVRIPGRMPVPPKHASDLPGRGFAPTLGDEESPAEAA